MSTFTVTYLDERSTMRFPVSVEAGDRMEALMRAGMKRGRRMALENRIFWLRPPRRFVVVSVVEAP